MLRQTALESNSREAFHILLCTASKQVCGSVQSWSKLQSHCMCFPFLCSLNWLCACVFLCASMQICASTFHMPIITLLQVPWSRRQLKEAAMELQDLAQTEAQRRAAQRSHLALILPPHVLHILTLGKLAGKLAEWRAWRKITLMTCPAVTFIACQKRETLHASVSYRSPQLFSN